MHGLDRMHGAPFYSQVAEGPTEVKAYWVFAEDKVRLRVAHWKTDETPHGTVLLLQGRTENIEKYGRTVEELHQAGFAAFAIDWRGQGLSDRLVFDRMVGHVLNYSDYQKDMAAMVQAAHDLDLPKPWFILGHSLGACVGLRAIIEGLSVPACAFTAPLWDINLSTLQRLGAWPISWAAQFLGQGHQYAPGTRGESYALHTTFDDNRLTHDPDMYQYYVNISKTLVDQQVGGPSMKWLFETLKETRSLSYMSSPDTPCITYCGAQDSIVAVPAIQKRMENWPLGKFKLLENSRHDVLCEVPNIRKNVLAEVCALFRQTSIAN
ncbi:MAG: alpha/beta hydrolase [Aliishimia sp.]